jgi:hypothetical protein
MYTDVLCKENEKKNPLKLLINALRKLQQTQKQCVLCMLSAIRHVSLCMRCELKSRAQENTNE